nr:hypothetical protein [uncultured Flavonifractor sp.]
MLDVLWAAPEGLPLGEVVEALRPATGWSRNTDGGGAAHCQAALSG